MSKKLKFLQSVLSTLAVYVFLVMCFNNISEALPTYSTTTVLPTYSTTTALPPPMSTTTALPPPTSTTTAQVTGSTTTALSLTTSTCVASQSTSFSNSISPGTDVNYVLPYLHTNAANVAYCQVSNQSSNSVYVNFLLKASTNQITPVSYSSGVTISKGSEVMLTFDGSSMSVSTYASNPAICFGDKITNATTAYGGILNFTTRSSLAYTSGTGSIGCDNITIACFQGTDSPRRNFKGHVCTDNSNGRGSNLGY